MKRQPSLKTTAQRFANDRRGTVAIVFAGALVPIIAVVGISVDYSRASHASVQLQSAVDAAAMAGAVSKAATVAGRTSAAHNTFDANAASFKHGISVTREATPGAGNITVTATATIPTVFMKLMNTNQLTSTASSTVHYGGKKLELAIVLDTTGSMNDRTVGTTTKLDELKAAIPTILDIVMPGGNTKVALVPFADLINVGSTNTSLLTGRVSPWQNNRCVLERKNGPRPNESAPNNNTNEFWIRTNNNNCNHVKPITPLTGDRATLDTAMTGLTAAGGTSGHLGIQWGWYAISPLWTGRWPTASTPVAYADESTMKAIVVLTDGNFTMFHLKPNGTSANCDGRTDCPDSRSEARSFCDAIKTPLDANGKPAVKIFTIGFGLEPAWSGDGQKSRHTMQYCASTVDGTSETAANLLGANVPKHFYFPVTEQDLKDAFSSIGNALTEAVNKPRFTN